MITLILLYFQHIPNLCNRFIIPACRQQGCNQDFRTISEIFQKSLDKPRPLAYKKDIILDTVYKNLNEKRRVLWKLH